MTRAEIRSLRTGLGLSPSQFAGLVGVSPSTAYRWEASGEAAARIDPHQRQLLALLVRQASVFTGGPPALGAALLEALRIRGPMFALYRLLSLEFADGHRAP